MLVVVVCCCVCFVLCYHLQEHDEAVLAHLTDIKVVYADDKGLVSLAPPLPPSLSLQYLDSQLYK